MSTKLTLTIEQSVIETAKQYAKYKQRSLSDLIENYLKILIKDIPKNDIKLSPTVKLLKGSFRAPKNFNYKRELTNRLTDKYMSS